MTHSYLILFFMLMTTTLSYASIDEQDSTEESNIEFEGFHAIQSHKVVHFTWDVKSESRGNHFIIEKSIDQIDWTEVTSIESLKSHKELHSYKISYINMPEAPSEYFRIVRVDKDGEKTFLDMIDIRQPILSGLLMLSAKGKAYKEVLLSFDSMIKSDGELSVTDNSGVVVYSKNVTLSAGPNNIPLWIKSLEEGGYLVTINDEFGNMLQKKLNIVSRKQQKRKF